MRSKSRASLPRSPARRKSAASSGVEPEAGPHTYAEYVERRRSLVSSITDELDEHALQMEERARQAVAHAAAVVQSSRAQEQACFDRLDRLEGKVQALQQARRAAAAELSEFQQAAAATRQKLESELQSLQSAVECARAADTVMQQHQDQHTLQQQQGEEQRSLRGQREVVDSDAARRSEDAWEQPQLQSMAAAVEVRFQQAVSALQAQVQERKAWADAQCALCEERVREAAKRADAAEFSAFLQHVSADANSSVPDVPPAIQLTRQPAVSAVEQQMRDLEKEMEELLVSAEARMEAIVAEQQSARGTLKNLNRQVKLKQSELMELSRMTQELSAILDDRSTAAAHPVQSNFSDVVEVRKTQPFAKPFEEKKHDEASGNLDSRLSLEEPVTVIDPAAPTAAETATSTKHPKSPSPCTNTQLSEQRNDGVFATPIKTATVSSRSRTASPSVQPPAEAAASLSPIRDVSVTHSASSPMRRGKSQSATFPEPTVVRDRSCSFDAFLAVSPIKLKHV